MVHNGTSSVGQKYTGSTALTNIHCTGDIEGKRVYFMTYQDLAEAYEPGEYLEPGDIVALHEDGLVYKAESTDVCIVGVISDEFANYTITNYTISNFYFYYINFIIFYQLIL